MIVLDTHALVWLVSAPERWGPTALELCRGEDVRFSAISTFELVIKSMLGRLSMDDDFVPSLPAQGLSELPFTTAHALAVRGLLELNGHDPFDRALVAQASVERATLVTADRKLLDLSISWIVDARL